MSELEECAVGILYTGTVGVGNGEHKADPAMGRTRNNKSKYVKL